MILGKITGNVVSTVKIKAYEGRKILIVQPISAGGRPTGKSFLAVDAAQAGVGDRVIVIDEGGSAQIMLGDTEGTIRTVIAGIVDEVNSDG